MHNSSSAVAAEVAFLPSAGVAIALEVSDRWVRSRVEFEVGEDRGRAECARGLLLAGSAVAVVEVHRGVGGSREGYGTAFARAVHRVEASG
jgi:hypothetical protein